MDLQSHNEKLVFDSRERRIEAYELRRRGLSFEEIGGMFGISRQRAHQLVFRAVELGEVNEGK